MHHCKSFFYQSIIKLPFGYLNHLQFKYIYISDYDHCFKMVFIMITNEKNAFRCFKQYRNLLFFVLFFLLCSLSSNNQPHPLILLALRASSCNYSSHLLLLIACCCCECDVYFCLPPTTTLQPHHVDHAEKIADVGRCGNDELNSF